MQAELGEAFLFTPRLTPEINSISPTTGPLKGGTVVTFRGSNLLPQASPAYSYLEDGGSYYDDYGADSDLLLNATAVRHSSHSLICMTYSGNIAIYSI